MVRWHHRLNGYEFEQTLGDSEGQGSLAYYSPWGHKVSHETERPNNNDIKLDESSLVNMIIIKYKNIATIH